MMKFKETSLVVLLILLVVASIAVAASAVKIFDTSGVPQGIKIAPDGSQDVNVQDQVTRSIDFGLSKITDLTPRLAEAPTPNTYTVTLQAGHTVTAGETLVILEITALVDPGHVHLMTSKVLGVSTNVLTLDEPVPYAFDPDEAILYTSIQQMNVDGSSITQIFQLTNAFQIAGDMTRLVIHITDATDMDDSLFGGISALTRGCVLRIKHSATHYTNIFNIKSNGEMGLLSGPIGKVYDSKAPAGVYGITTMVEFAGQSKHGVAIRIQPGESLEFLIQDDLTDLLSMEVMAQGHFTN